MFVQIIAKLTQNERLNSSVILLALSCFGFLDFYFDVRNRAPTGHLIMEAVLSILGTAWGAKLAFDLMRVKRGLASLESNLILQRNAALKWQSEASKFIDGLHGLIIQQFEDWKLSASEIEVAMFLLKGFSLKEIARFRSVSERTISQQTVSIYAKAGLNGRVELTAFFFEDLLAPSQQLKSVSPSDN